MPAIDATVTATEPGTDDGSHPACTVCPHPWDAHDRIGMRYCTASAAGGLERGCVCGGGDYTTKGGARTGVMPYRGRTP
jgi:hypothetical protein